MATQDIWMVTLGLWSGHLGPQNDLFDMSLGAGWPLEASGWPLGASGWLLGASGWLLQASEWLLGASD